MKLLTMRTNDGLRLGVKTQRGIVDIKRALDAHPGTEPVASSVDGVIEGGSAAVAALEHYVRQLDEIEAGDYLHQEEDVQFGPCVPNPGKIICVGLNYRRHAEESALQVPDFPLLFSKFQNAVAAHEDTITLPSDAVEVDYEAELVIVIGKTAQHVAKEEALQYVFGYCNGNDLSARDLQFRTSQWLLGKSLDGFCPLGPYLVTANEIANPQHLGIRCYVNGELRQNSSTENMIFDCADIVTYASQYMTLSPGDIIMAGTPDGVIFGYPKDEQVWLKDGDEVVVEIDHLGKLVNRMKRVLSPTDNPMDVCEGLVVRRPVR